jgi:tartrate dehydrogenase/decarboxylase/D-malate dehydrogenase
MRNYKIAAIPADGIGPEVPVKGLHIKLQLRIVACQCMQHFNTCRDDFRTNTGVMMPEEGLNTLKKFDAIYFGAVGAPDVPDHITL